MGVVNEVDQTYAQSKILPSIRACYRPPAKGRIETPADNLLHINYLYMRPTACVDEDLFIVGRRALYV